MKISADIKQLKIAFQHDKRTLVAVDDISFSLHAGETLALLGESGCGKSLTSLAMMRLLPERALYGKASQILLDELDTLQLPEYVMRQLRGRRLAIIFQEPMTALNPVLRIGEQLAEAFHGQEFKNKAFLHQRMIELLEEVELSSPELRLQQYPHQLSGGQKQRVVIAMALANKPDILIADEPTTALDVTIQAQILTLLRKLQRSHHMSMLLITHDLGVVKTAADRVCVMYAGQVVEEASVQDFFRQVKHPYSQQLLASMPGMEKRGYRLQAISGHVPSLDVIPPGCRFHPRCVHAMPECCIEIPVLQKNDKRSIRCHLYPRLHEPPSLEMYDQAWPPNQNSEERVFSVTDLKVYFTSRRRLFGRKEDIIKAVDGLSFQLSKGKTLALVGESGCGKTTASRALMRLLPITSGSVEFGGTCVRTMSRRALGEFRKRVQIIFQDPWSSMNPRMTAGEIIAEGMLANGMTAYDISQRQKQLLDHVNLPRNSLSRYPHQFSGGQRQRICIARALATRPEVLICDEPTSALDMSVQAQILNLLKELQLETGIAMLFITHNMSVVSWLADDVLVMRHGKQVEAGPCETVLTHPQQNYTQALLASATIL